jgi:penicillin-binding protein 1C
LLTGVGAAGPLLFDVLALLPSAGWFQQPLQQMTKVEICSQSGDRAGLWCDKKIVSFVPKSCLNAPSCRFHKIIHLDKITGERTNLSCSDNGNLTTKSFFILPPLVEYYYKQEHPEYADLPAWKSGCSDISSEIAMQFIYPPSGAKLIIPKSFDGNSNTFIAQIAHRNPDSRVFWFLNGKQLQATRTFHQMAIQNTPGNYELLAVDEKGNRISRKFTIVTK